ncbi:MAG: CotH kinase family protein [Bacteroidaceae bacterium]|nr:CotH kinase family protein [Bacteroidaceae bacterium]
MKLHAVHFSALLALCLSVVQTAAQQAPTAADRKDICLNEIQVENIDAFVDPSWNYGPWVEVLNLSDKDYDLKGCWVSDEPDNPMKVHVTQSHPLKAHGFVNLWFEHHDKYCLRQLGLKLSTSGGTFLLSDPYGQLLQRIDYPAPVPRTSYARREDGADEWGTTGTPTPAASNGTQTFCTERAPAPVVNIPGGVYKGRVFMTVSIPEGGTLRYTTDGSTPTLTNGSTTRAGRFSFTKTSCVRLRLYMDGMLPSPVVTHTYIIENFDIPLAGVAVTTDPDHLYSAELGIFTRGVNGRAGLGQSTPCNWNMDWDRPMNFEYFDAQGKQVVNQEAGMKRNGAYSRAYTPYGWKVNAEKIYEGNNRLSYQFFHHKPYLRHKQIVFRSAGNDYNCRLRDAAVQEIVIRSGLNVDAQSYEPVVHFLNGLYRGTINLREPNNKNYVFSNYGYDDDEIDFFEMDGDSGYVQKCGDRAAWERLYELAQTAANDASYAEIEKLIDVDEICNYMAVEFFMGNDDWPKNNLKGWRPLQEDGRFRFILYDIDHAFGLSTPFTSFASKKTWTWNPLYNEFNESIPRIKGEVEIVTIFLNLLKNPTFCRHFIDAFCIVGGSVFEPSRCEAIITELCNQKDEIQQVPDNGYDRNQSPWSTGNTMITNYQGRQAPMFAALRNYAAFGLTSTTPINVRLGSDTPRAQIFVNGQIVPTGDLDGQLFPPVVLRAEAPAGYAFTAWRLLEGHVGTTTETVFAEGSEWRYYDRGSLDGTPTWKRPTYNDTNWSEGAAPLGYDKNNAAFRTLLDYGPDSSDKRSTYYFRKTFDLSEAPTEECEIQFSYSLDDGMVLYVNGTEAFRTNMPSGAVYFSTFSTTHSANNPDVGSVVLPSALFQQGKNVLAVEVHNNNKTSSDIYWDAALRIRRPTALDNDTLSTSPELALPDGTSLNLVACFVPLPEHARPAPVVINEVSAANSIYVNEYFKKADWVELYNTTDADLDLAGMYLSDEPSQPTKYAISGGTSGVGTIIPAHGRRIIWCDREASLSQLHAPFKLSNADQCAVVLTAADESWADTLIYCAHAGVESVGRFPDGTPNLYRMSRPTIEQPNTMTMLSTRWTPLPLPDGDGNVIEDLMAAARDGAMHLSMHRGQLVAHSEDCADALLQIYAMDGTLVMRTPLRFEGERLHVSVALLAPGTYIARLSGSDGNGCSLKFRF